MRVLEMALSDVAAAISSGARADYVYMYPPRQAYSGAESGQMEELVRSALAQDGPLNLYVHVPFCRQICAYCNLFAIAGDRGDEHENYVDLVLEEFTSYLRSFGNRTVGTVYVGGGTPSAMSAAALSRLTRGLERIGGFALDAVPEVALEVAPDTVSEASLRGFRDAGINRINLGVQSWDDGELHGIGRHHGHEIHGSALDLAMSAGFANVCVDLIYGLPGQTAESWEQSLNRVIAHRPETVCCYALTLRPKTGYAAKGVSETDSAEQYRRYDVANEMLQAAGYVQQTHVRWVLPGLGGYLQKENHWAGQDILGVGAGARSYLSTVDTRNGYSVRSRVGAYRGYLASIGSGQLGLTDGFVMTDSERLRKAVILGLGRLDRSVFVQRFGVDPVDEFAEYFRILEDLDLVSVDSSKVALTPLGQRHRDVIVQPFFSPEVRRQVAEFDYDE